MRLLRGVRCSGGLCRGVGVRSRRCADECWVLCLCEESSNVEHILTRYALRIRTIATVTRGEGQAGVGDCDNGEAGGAAARLVEGWHKT